MINREQNAYTWLVNGLLRVVLISNVLSANVVVCMVPAAIDKVTQVVGQNKALISHYEIDQIPVESGLYFQRVVDGYNARVKRDVIAQLKQSVAKGNTHAKELMYLFDNLSTNRTMKQAMTLLMRAITAHRLMDKDNTVVGSSVNDYDRVYAAILLQCCVVLTNGARDQFLGVLEDINNSLIYWRDQKNHPTKYFFHKSPLKWVMGSSQVEEVASNIKKLEKVERDVRIVLGQMIKHIYEFNPSSTVEELYVWVDNLFSILSLVGTPAVIAKGDKNFDAIAETLRFKLSHVGQVKSKILSHVASAKIPGHFVRNWMAYTLAAGAAYQGYNFYVAPGNAQWVSDRIGLEALGSYGNWLKDYVQVNAITPLKDIFIGTPVAKGDFQDSDIALTRQEMVKLLNKLSEGEKGWGGSISGQIKGKPLLKDEMQNIIEEEKKGNITPFLDLLYKMDKKVVGNLVSRDDLIQAGLIYTRLLLYHGIQYGLKEGINPLMDELRVTKNLAILAPTLLASVGIGLGASKMYNWLTARDYSSVRAALIEINALFIESLAPLNDHDYGKLVYLLQGLKKHALHYLPTKNNVRSEFLVDIAKLESQQFSVKTKRSIIKNMFNKYLFLSGNAKTS